MEKNSEQLERYLSEFRARAVRPLEIPQPAAKSWFIPLAVAAIVILCAGGLFWYAGRGGKSTTTTAPASIDWVKTAPAAERLNPFSLTKLALEDDRTFQAQLAAESARVLPSFQGSQSTLKVLVQE